MKLNKFFILISLLIVLVVSMGMVSATEDIKSDIVFEDIGNVALNDLSVDDEKIVNLESKESINPSLGNLGRIVREAEPGSTIKLDADFDYTIDASVFIDKPLTIDGQGHTINGKYKGIIFKVDVSKGKIIIKNINFVNCSGKNYASAIYAWGNYVGIKGIQIINCNFTNCHYDSLENPTIQLYKTYGAEIINCKFVNCTNNNMKGGGSGRCILFNDSRSCSVRNCTFIFSRNYWAYAVSDQRNGSSGFTVYNCNFVNCEIPRGAEGLSPSSDFINKQGVNNNVNTSVGNMENCGNPLLALLIALISLPILRRRK